MIPVCFEETEAIGKLEQNPIRLEYDHLGLRYMDVDARCLENTAFCCHSWAT